MWWISGFINVIVVLAFAWFYHKKIKMETAWLKDDKIALGTLLVFAFLSGFLGTLLLVGLLVYTIIDFVKFVRK